jgi:cupin fold WbuC family metalloprotein
MNKHIQYIKSIKYLKRKKFDEDKKAKSLSFFYKGKSQDAILDNNLISQMKVISNYLNKNLRINLHSSVKSTYHDMIILQRRGTHVLPHKHPIGGETVHIIEGKLKVILYNKGGKEIKNIIMDKNKNFIYRVPGKIFHCYKIISKIAIYHEDKNGPFVKKSGTIYPKWS